MIIGCWAFIGNLLDQTSDADDAGTGPVLVTLAVVHWAIVLAALLAAGWLVVVWNRDLRRDPLGSAPVRANSLREDALLIALGVYLMSVSLLALLVDAVLDDPESTLSSIIVGTGGQAIGAIACLLIAWRRFKGGTRAFLLGPGPGTANDAPSSASPATHNERGVLVAPGGYRIKITALVLVLALGLCPLIGELTLWVVQVIQPERQLPPHPTLAALRSGAEPAYVVALLWLGAAVTAPVAEELFFRGLVQTWLVDRLGSRWRAIGITAVGFGLVHTGQVQAVPALLVLAVLLGFAYERTGSLLVPIMIHVGFNVRTLVWDALGAYRL